MSYECQGRQQHGWFGHGTCDNRAQRAAYEAVGVLPAADRPRYERWLTQGGMATLLRAAPVLFGKGGAAEGDGTGPTASGLARAIHAAGPYRWPRVVADAAEQAEATAKIELPPGNYFAPLVPLMNAILAVRPGDDVGALRRAIREAFYDKGDSIGGNQVNAILSDLTNPSATDADRRSAADELAHYARADPAEIGQLRTALAGGVLAGTSAATAEGLAAAKTQAQAEAQRIAASLQKQISAAIQKALASPDPAMQLEAKTALQLQNAGLKVVSFRRPVGRNASIGEVDIETEKAIIEVTAARSRKLGQIQILMNNPSVNPAGKSVILYAPNYQGTAAKAVIAAGASVARTQAELVGMLKTLGGR